MGRCSETRPAWKHSPDNASKPAARSCRCRSRSTADTPPEDQRGSEVKHQAADGGARALLRYLHHVQLGEEVAVRQGQRVAVQETARRLGHVRVLVQLAGQRRLQVRVQLLQGGVELLPQP